MAQAPSAYSSHARSAKPPASWRVSRSKPIDHLWRGLAAQIREINRTDGCYDERALAGFKGREDYDILEVVTRGAMTVAGREDQLLELNIKSATSPASTVTAGWASEVLAVVNSQFVSALAQLSVAGALFSEGMAIDVTQPRGVVRVPTRASTPTVQGSYIGEGQPIPVRRPGLSSITLGPKKLGVISEMSREIVGHSQPAVESVIKQIILEDTSAAVDTILLDTVPADAIRPAGLRNGIAGLTPNSTATTAYDKMIADMKALLAAIAPSSRPVLLVNNASQAVSLSWAAAPEQFQPGMQVIASASVAAGMVIAVDLNALCFTSLAPIFDLSKDALIHEEDSSPQPIGAPGPVVAAPSRSLWQTDILAVRYIWWLNWGLRRTNGVSWMTGVGW